MSLRTLTDCASAENVKDARADLRRCTTEAEFAAWAAKWGEALIARALDVATACTDQPMAIEERLL